MVVGELRHGQLTIIDRLKETVRLSEGLEKTGELTEAARERAIDCLSRFGERLRHMHASNVRAAGTSTFRRARGKSVFNKDAEAALGHPIETISGREEARLIYRGVAHSTPPYDGVRLVLDIGGGSTELILGQANQPRALESLHMGCVVMTERYFTPGVIDASEFDNARLAIRLELRPIKSFFRGVTNVEVIGTSGTILATQSVARELGLIEEELTVDAVGQLIEMICKHGNTTAAVFPGLSERRAQVWPGGIAILFELMAALRIDKLKTSDGALREGLLYDSLGRLQHRDARERSVRAMAARYNVDSDQATRVADAAAILLQQCARSWDLSSDLADKLLGWSACLHEIGLDISHEHFHRHGAYIAGNADLPGFPHAEQQVLAFLILSQRRHIDMRTCAALPVAWRKSAERLSILLRLACLLNRNRSNEELPQIEFAANERRLVLKFPESWLHDNPLTIADLQRESKYLAAADYALSYS